MFIPILSCLVVTVQLLKPGLSMYIGRATANATSQAIRMEKLVTRDPDLELPA